MPRWLFAAAITTVAVAFAAAPARAGWFSPQGGCHDECVPTCSAPAECYSAPTCCAPAAPTCCAPAYNGCGEVYCDGSYQNCEREGCFRRSVKKLWDLEKRKNRCLKETFCGWMNRGHHGGCDDCAPLEYYQPACGAPAGCCH